MRTSDSIFEFIDGSLDSAEEQELFNEMASRPELRSELRQFIAIGEAVRADREAYIPPADVERDLMIGLGIAPIAGSAGYGAGMLARFSRLVPIAASFVVGALVAGGGVYWATNESDSTRSARSADSVVAHESSRPVVSDTNIALAPSTNRTTTSPAPTSSDAASGSLASNSNVVARPTPSTQIASQTTRRSASSINSRRTTNPVVVTSRSISSANDDASIVESSTNVISNEPSNDVAPIDDRTEMRKATAAVDLRTFESAPSSVTIPANRDHNVRGSLFPTDAIASVIDEDPRNDGFFFVRRDAISSPYVDNHAKHITPQAWDEAGAGVFLGVADGFAVGIEGGRGRYTQVLVIPEDYMIGSDAIGKRVSRIEQAPIVNWIGVGLRQTISEPTNGVNVWLHESGGWGLSNGPVLGLRTGVTYELPAGLAVNAALETSALIYMFNSQPLFTGKYGVTFGLQYGW